MESFAVIPHFMCKDTFELYIRKYNNTKMLFLNLKQLATLVHVGCMTRHFKFVVASFTVSVKKGPTVRKTQKNPQK